MQIPLQLGLIKHHFLPKKGMTVRPKQGKLVCSSIINGWQTALVHKVNPYSHDEDIYQVDIRGIVNGKEFRAWEFSDGIEEMP